MKRRQVEGEDSYSLATTTDASLRILGTAKAKREKKALVFPEEFHEVPLRRKKERERDGKSLSSMSYRKRLPGSAARCR